MRKATVFLVLAGLLALFVVPMLPAPRGAQPAVENTVVGTNSYPTPRVPHAAIAIANHADWHAESTAGDGSIATPFIIEDLEIDCAGAGAGITIAGTTDYAIIRNVFVNASGAGATDVGMVLQGV